MRLPWYCSKLKLYYCCSIKNVNEIVARSVEILHVFISLSGGNG